LNAGVFKTWRKNGPGASGRPAMSSPLRHGAGSVLKRRWGSRSSRDGTVQRSVPRKARGILAACALSLAAAGCSSDLALFRADSSWWSSGKSAANEPLSRTASADALVSADGTCPPPVGEPSRAVAVGMTECDVLNALGPSAQVEVGSADRGQRTVVMTVAEGERAGIYRFKSGLLASVEENPAKVQAKPKPKPKPRAQVARPKPKPQPRQQPAAAAGPPTSAAPAPAAPAPQAAPPAPVQSSPWPAPAAQPAPAPWPAPPKS
jgi:hypothetical protein